MAQKPIRELDAKRLLYAFFRKNNRAGILRREQLAEVNPGTDILRLSEEQPWLKDASLAAKPDQLIKRRGKQNLVSLGKTYGETLAWIKKYMNRNIEAGGITGRLSQFIIEPFIAHDPEDEYYVCIRMNRRCDEILFHHRGGVEAGDIESKALTLNAGNSLTEREIATTLLPHVAAGRKANVAAFIKTLHEFFADHHFTFIEINPFVCTAEGVVPLDMAAKLDDTARHLQEESWGRLAFPAPFGRTLTPEERKVADMDARTGSSLKLTLLNPDGRIWLLIAGGGASVVYADTVAGKGYGKDLANYGEYSGDPDEDMTYEYACTVLDLMTRSKREEGKVLLIGGGIANFTDVARTFRGIIRALQTYERRLKEHGVKIYVRRAGPNYREALDNMKAFGCSAGIPVDVYGPETHMTRIVRYALETPEYAVEHAN